MNSKEAFPYIEDHICERCGDQMDEGLNSTPFGYWYCEDCITIEDVFPEDDEEET